MRESSVTHHPNHDAVCFHVQQCVEKLMKAGLIHVGAHAPKIHDLSDLSGLLKKVHPQWQWDEAELDRIGEGAIAGRYPGEEATADEAAAAIDVMVRIRPPLLRLLDAPPAAT